MVRSNFIAGCVACIGSVPEIVSCNIRQIKSSIVSCRMSQNITGSGFASKSYSAVTNRLNAFTFSLPVYRLISCDIAIVIINRELVICE
jgi:hypothetical protein